MADPTGQEVLMWALVNRARLDPSGEAARYGINLNEGPVTDFQGNVHTITTASKQPLAWNAALFAVADQHSEDMRAQGGLFHNSQTVHEANLTAAGYSFSAWGENVSMSLPITAQYTSTQAIYDQHQALFVDSGVNGRGHRYNIMLDTYQELGVGQVVGPVQGTTRSMITQDFGRPSAATQFLTGIAYNDTNGDAFYSVGEGRNGITVATTAGNVATAPAGNYSRAVNAGANQIVTFSGGDLAAPVSVSITVLAGRNALVDLVGQSAVETSVSLTALNGVIKIIGLGNTGLTLIGNAADNTIVSALGNDILDGMGGFDTAVYAGNRANYTITNNANGTVTVAGAQGTDTLSAFEQIQFNDQVVAVVGNPGSVSINDVTITEGNAGTKVMTFTVTRTGGTSAFSVNFATSNGSATVADNDYVARSGTLQFAANVNTRTIDVTINGDVKVEAHETFVLTLSGLTNGATFTDSTGIGTISNDDVGAVVRNDFNRDGTSDILWRNSNTGAVRADLIQNGQFQSSSNVGQLGLEWKVQGTGDFDRDGDADILWRNSNTGVVRADLIENGQFQSTATVGQLGLEWKVQGIGDFDRDGDADILWRNADTGVVRADLIQNGQFQSTATVGQLGLEWKVQGTGDFDRDGDADILWRNSNTGAARADLIENGQFQSTANVGQLGLEWKVQGTGDFDRDGDADILWRNSNTGAVRADLIQNGQFQSTASVGQLGLEWTVQGIGDFDRDGDADILWRNGNTGAVRADLLENGQFQSTASVGQLGLEWQVSGFQYDII
jgi:hypothetical protein